MSLYKLLLHDLALYVRKGSNVQSWRFPRYTTSCHGLWRENYYFPTTLGFSGFLPVYLRPPFAHNRVAITSKAHIIRAEKVPKLPGGLIENLPAFSVGTNRRMRQFQGKATF